MRSLADRIRAFEQQKARMADVEARLKLAEKKAHTRRLLESGILVEKSGLLTLAPDVLYGALLSLHSGLDNSKQVEQWRAAGERALAQEGRNTDESRAPMLLKIPMMPDREGTTELRLKGFRFNKLLQHWEGVADVEEAEKLAAAYGGTLETIEVASTARA